MAPLMWGVFSMSAFVSQSCCGRNTTEAFYSSFSRKRNVFKVYVWLVPIYPNVLILPLFSKLEKILEAMLSVNHSNIHYEVFFKYPV